MTSRMRASSTVPVKPLAVRLSMTLVLIMRMRLAVRRSFALSAGVSCSRSCPSRFVDIPTTYHSTKCRGEAPAASSCGSRAAGSGYAGSNTWREVRTTTLHEVHDGSDHREHDQQV